MRGREEGKKKALPCWKSLSEYIIPVKNYLCQLIFPTLLRGQELAPFLLIITDQRWLLRHRRAKSLRLSG